MRFIQEMPKPPAWSVMQLQSISQNASIFWCSYLFTRSNWICFSTLNLNLFKSQPCKAKLPRDKRQHLVYYSFCLCLKNILTISSAASWITHSRFPSSATQPLFSNIFVIFLPFVSLLVSMCRRESQLCPHCSGWSQALRNRERTSQTASTHLC